MNDTRVDIYEFDQFRVDARKRLLLRDCNPVRLPTKAFEILLVLLEGNGRLVEKDELMERVWPDAVVEENNLTVNISALRKSLSESPGEHRYVLTVPGRGYQFVAELWQPGSETSLANQKEIVSNQEVAELNIKRSSSDGHAQSLLVSNNGDSGSQSA